MEVNAKKSKSVLKQTNYSLRLDRAAKTKLFALREEANKKTYGKKIKPQQIVDLGLSLITTEHLEALKKNSLSNKNRQEKMRAFYSKTRRPISEDEFIGFTWSAEFQSFKMEYEAHMRDAPNCSETAKGVA